MDEAKKRKVKRRRGALARLGTASPACTCGERDPRCLELHEPGGRRYNDMRVPICRNCHRKLSDDQRDHPKAEFTPPDPLERLAHALLGEADFFVQLSEKRRADAKMLLAHVRKQAIPPADDAPGGGI